MATSSEAAFRLHVYERLVALLDRKEDNNLDTAYPADGAVLDAAAYARKRAKFLAFLSAHAGELFRAMTLFEDQASRSLFIDLLLFRSLGYERVRLPSNTDAFWAAKAAAKSLVATPSTLNSLPGGSHLMQFRLDRGGQASVVDCLPANVIFTNYLRQYHFNRDGVTIAPEPGDVAVDGGACFGDTTVGFAHAVGPLGKVCTFDPVAAHLTVVNHNVAQNGLENVLVYPSGLGRVDQFAPPSSTAINPGFTTEGEEAMPIRSLDGLVAEGSVPRVDFIKLDIEGNELAALEGATETLRRFVPKLAISIYHRWDDYYRIPTFIAGLGLGYRMYLENYTISDGETVLYCTRAAD